MEQTKTLVAIFRNNTLSVYVRSLRELGILPTLWADGYCREVLPEDMERAISLLRGKCEVEGERFYYIQ